MSLLELTPEERNLLSPDELARMEAEAEIAFLNADRLTFAQWDHLVATWNEVLDPVQRKQAHAKCVRQGHDWAGLPFAARVCRRCIAYVVED